jgi:hypothetical protein
VVVAVDVLNVVVVLVDVLNVVVTDADSCVERVVDVLLEVEVLLLNILNKSHIYYVMKTHQHN